MQFLELKIPPVVLTLLAAGAMWALAVAVPALTWMVPYAPAVALGLAGAGAAVAVAGVLSFRRAGTTVNPTTPHATSTLVCSGIYRVSRNPMYLGFALLLLGWAAWLGNGLSLALLGAFVAYMNRFQIVPEERALAAAFGAPFAEYQRRVRRWI